MTEVQTTLEEIGTKIKTPTFLAQVERLATTIDDFLIPSLRLEIHPDSWSPVDFLQEIPETQGVDLFQETIAKIVEQYLGETDTKERVTGIKKDRFSYTVNPLDDNASRFSHTVDCWRNRHYSLKHRIDGWVETMQQNAKNSFLRDASMIASSLGVLNMLGPSLNGTLAHSMAQYTQELYQQTGVQGEEPVRLYQLCFQALAQAKGWDKLKDKDLCKVLDAEGIPVKEFAELTGREIEHSAEPVIEVGENNAAKIHSSSAAIGRCNLVSASSWFSALEELRRQGSGKTIAINGQTYVRPFTMKENLQARIEDYSTLINPDGAQRTEEERKRSFNTWLDSCSGIHYLAGTTRFKIIPRSNELITLTQAPVDDYLSVPYDQTSGTEFDSSRGKYNQALSRAEVLEQPAWLAVVEEDRALLGEAFDVMRTVKKAPADWKGMGFFVYPDKTQDELRPPFTSSQGRGGDADGRYLLGNDGRFLRR